MAQSVKCQALDFSSGHDVMVLNFKPCVGLCVDSAEPTWGSLSPSLPLPDSCFFLSHEINKLKKMIPCHSVVRMPNHELIVIQVYKLIRISVYSIGVNN